MPGGGFAVRHFYKEFCMDVSSLLQQAVARLQASGSDEPEANAQWLLAYVLGVRNRAHPDDARPQPRRAPAPLRGSRPTWRGGAER